MVGRRAQCIRQTIRFLQGYFPRSSCLLREKILRQTESFFHSKIMSTYVFCIVDTFFSNKKKMCKNHIILLKEIEFTQLLQFASFKAGK